MSNVPSTYDDDINLLSLILTIWDGKWKIVFIIAVSLISVLCFNIIKPSKSFIAKTEIKPITSFEFDKYRLFNSSLKIIEPSTKKNKEKEEKSLEDKVFNIFEITQKSLLGLYVESIREGSLFETGIDKFNLIDKDDFDGEGDYREAVEKFASEIKIILPIKETNGIITHHVLMAEYNDEDKWKDLLTFVDNEANLKVKASIINRFATIVSVQNQKKDFAIKDLELKIDNVKDDYKRTTKDRLAFLAEQAAIARKLEIQKNTIASQRFNTQNTFVTNVKTDAPFYLRGYVAIEEEMNQVKNRKSVNSFTKDLYKLERQKRKIDQNMTIKRAITLFNKTPLNQNDFKATIVKVATTDFETNNKKNLYYALAIIIGGIIGVAYVLIANAFITRNDIKLSS